MHTGRQGLFVEADLLDAPSVLQVIENHGYDADVHFAGPEGGWGFYSTPFDVLKNNIVGTMNLIEVMESAGVRQSAFSSSATV